MKLKKRLTRHRLQTSWFKAPVLVLQIGTLKNTGSGDEVTPSCHNKDYYSWRDAVMTDIGIKLIED